MARTASRLFSRGLGSRPVGTSFTRWLTRPIPTSATSARMIGILERWNPSAICSGMLAPATSSTTATKRKNFRYRNSPRITAGFHLSRIPIILALVALVGIGLVNHLVKLVPTGLEPKPREKSLEAVRAMFYAIEKDTPAYAQKVLAMNFDPSLHHENGYTPLAYAAAK